MGRRTCSKPLTGRSSPLFVKFMREHPNVWSKVSCPERRVGHRPEGAERPSNMAYRDVIPSRGVSWSVPRPRALGHRLATPT